MNGAPNMSKRKSNLVVKTNWLNTALQTLTQTEIRIIQLAIIDARETNTGLDTNTPLMLTASRYAEMFGGTRQAAYDAMKRAEKTLFERRFTFMRTNAIKPTKSRWLQEVTYQDGQGAIELVFTKAVVEGISRIDGLDNFFTSYLLEQTTKLKSVYSVRLYELLIQWKKAKRTPIFELEKFRGQMGVGVNEYPQMNDFKKRVLERAIKEINKHTDIKVSYEQEKKGVKIVGFKFKISQKPKAEKDIGSKRDPDTIDMFTEMSDKQIGYFSHKLANDVAFGGQYARPGETTQAFEQRIQQELNNAEMQKKWKEHLKRVGFKP